MIMKENHNATFCDSKSYGKETNPLAFGVKEIYQLDDSRKGADPKAFEGNGRDDEDSNSNIMVHISNDDESGRADSLTNEVPGGLLQVSGLETDADYESSVTKDGEKLHSSASLELSNVDEFILCKESEPRDSGTIPPITKSNLLETDKNQCIDKTVLECQLAELIVSDKKINDQSVKDICVDEGIPAKDKKLTGSCKGDQSGTYFSQIPSDSLHCSGTEGVDDEFIISDRTSLENTERFGDNDSGNIEVNDDKVLSQSMPKSPPDSSFDRDTAENCDPEDSMKTDEAIRGTTGKIFADIREEIFLIDHKLFVQELGERRSLRSLFNSFDGEEGIFVQPLDQTSAGNEVFEIPASSSAEVEPMDNNQPDNNVQYNSNLFERGSTSDFNHSAPGGTSIPPGQTENVVKQSIESKDVDAHTDGNVDDASDSRFVRSPSIRDHSAGAVEEQDLDREYVNFDNSSDTSKVHCISSEDTRGKTNLVESYDQEDIKSNELPASSGEVETSASSKNQSSIINEDRPIEPSVTKHDRKNSNDASAVSNQLLLYGEEEPSLSAAGLITYSGPIAYSGSISLRSDGSATSGKSFAFPILPSEWNSSPVRMAKADRRHYQKQKSWRSGIFCCRF